MARVKVEVNAENLAEVGGLFSKVIKAPVSVCAKLGLFLAACRNLRLRTSSLQFE